jgi:DNA adenine methylase
VGQPLGENRKLPRCLIRYPGAKSGLSSKIVPLISRHCEAMGISKVCEPFVGAGGLTLALARETVFFGTFSMTFELFDADYALVELWNAVLEADSELESRIRTFKPHVEVFYQFKEDLLARKLRGLDAAFAKLAVHQLSYSGMGEMTSPIGGRAQSGKWLVDCRWDSNGISRKFDRIRELLCGRATIRNEPFDRALTESASKDAFIYLDPPYYKVGKALYSHGLDHEGLASLLEKEQRPWMLSYDNDPWVSERYKLFHSDILNVNYTLSSKREDSEMLIASFPFCS